MASCSSRAVGASCRHSFDRRNATSVEGRYNGLDQGRLSSPSIVSDRFQHGQPCHLGQGGAERLLRCGDVLWLQPGDAARRVHTPLVTEAEIETFIAQHRALTAVSRSPDPENSKQFHQTRGEVAPIGEAGQSRQSPKLRSSQE